MTGNATVRSSGDSGAAWKAGRTECGCHGSVGLLGRRGEMLEPNKARSPGTGDVGHDAVGWC